MQMRALNQHFRDEKQRRDEILAQKPASAEQDADFERITKMNDEWNRQVAEVRQARLAKERVEEEIRILEDIEQRKEKQEAERRRVNELVLKEKVRFTLKMDRFFYLPLNFSDFPNTKFSMPNMEI